MKRIRAVVCSLLAAIVLPAVAADAPKQASFRVKHAFTVKVPEGAKVVRVWLAVPQEDANSAVRNLTVRADQPVHYAEDSWANRVGYLEFRAPKAGPLSIVEEFDLTRTEIRNKVDPAATRPLTPAEKTALQRYLLPTTYVVVNDRVRKLSASIVGDETNPVRQARKIYDWTLENVDYWVKDPDRLKASPVGSTEYCLDTGTGNCTDFHSLYASLSIAAGLPTRIVYGSLLKPTLNGIDTDASYHCWIQFYAPNLGWLPLDVSVADLYAKEFPLSDKNRRLVELTTATGYKGVDKSKVDYYFGNLDERRVVWSAGRDLILQPPQDAGPVNALHKMHVEIDGKEFTDWTRVLTYSEVH